MSTTIHIHNIVSAHVEQKTVQGTHWTSFTFVDNKGHQYSVTAFHEAETLVVEGAEFNNFLAEETQRSAIAEHASLNIRRER